MCNCLFCLTSGGARCCAMFSTGGACFLIFLGILFEYQSDYLHGFYGNPEKAETAQKNCLFLYIIIIIINAVFAFLFFFKVIKMIFLCFCFFVGIVFF